MWTRINLLAASVTLAATALVTQAQAQTFYVGGEGGWTALENQRDRGNLAGGAAVHSRFDDGFAAGARAGYEWGPWRFEEEYAYRENDLTGFRVGGARVGANGDRHTHAIMTNVLYDVPLGWTPMGMAISPHIGGGVGAVNLTDHVRSGALRYTDDDWQLGYQAIGGVRYNISPNLALDLDYKYLATTDASFRVPGTALRYKSGYETHNLMASLVYRFGPPPPPPAPPVAAPMPSAPPPAMARRVFMVFFDWDRDTITRDGLGIIQQAAAAYKSGAPVQIQVTGYTDRSGSPGYNQRLSERRATNVANALARLGVQRNDMAVSGRGENDNRVPTADGVREPQNRRVEIVFP